MNLRQKQQSNLEKAVKDHSIMELKVHTYKGLEYKVGPYGLLENA